MVKRMGWLIGLLCCLAFNNSYAATITAEFDRNPVALGDPVNLRFTADDTVEEPNFAVLEKDFEIRGHSQSNSFNMDNNGINTSTTWELNVVPKTTGTLKVPSIAFGKAYSPALELTVTDLISNHKRLSRSPKLPKVKAVYSSWVKTKAAH